MNVAHVQSGCGCDHDQALTEMMSVEEALHRALAQVQPLTDIQSVTLAEAMGRITAKPVLAPAAMPFFDNSAMDGFALCCADLARLDALPIAGTVAAGDAPRPLDLGTALRIFTGAPLPEGADAVVMVERCLEIDGEVSFAITPNPGDNIRRAGSDQAAGQELLRAGTRIAPHHIGILAANGIERVDVIRRPRVAVFSTGDEICTGPRAAGQIPDANRPMLIALARQTGAEVTDLGILPDNADATAAALRKLGDAYDLILSSGAVSMGGKDHIRAALMAAGGTVQGWRVALKPGKPVMFGTLARTAFTGLPGNPFAVHVGFHLFAGPQIARLSGMLPTAFAPVPAISGFDWTRTPGRAEVFPVRLLRHDAGLPVLERLGQSVSATLLPLADADGLAIVSADTVNLRCGDALRWHPFCPTTGVQ